MLQQITILGVDLYYIWNAFFMFSFFGWAFESVYVSLHEGKLVNRGFISGPFCTVYGCAGIAMYLLLHPLKDKLILLYIGGVVVSTVIEYITAVLMETIFHAKWWDYSHLRFNFQGRISLSSSLTWGLFAVGLMKILYPGTVWLMNLYTIRQGEIALSIITILFLIDFTVSWIEASDIAGKLDKLTEMQNEVHEKFDESKLGELRDDINDKLEEVNIGEKTDDLRTKILGYYDKYMSMIKESNIVQKRFMRAYPALRNYISTKQEQFLNAIEPFKSKIQNLISRGDNDES